ncbi:MAG: hypothetical protein PHI97_24450 [Desulfobulbus sp.]|nr:hypothetical protein [Desulfobulbus sp.]
MELGRKLLGYFGAALVGLIIGYFAGREHLKYEMRITLQSAAQEMQKSLASAFAAPPSTKKSQSTTQKIPPKPIEEPPISATLVKKGFQGSDYKAGILQEAITFSVSFENLTGKDIRAFDGVLIFNDLLDNRVISSSLAINEHVKANSALKWDGQLDYNQFKDSHKRLRSEDQTNLKVTFAARKVLFSDGTTKEFE